MQVMLYNPDMVNEAVKTRLIAEMIQYNSSYVTGQLGIVFLELIKNHSTTGETSSSPELDEIAQFYPNDRGIIYSFHNRLQKKGAFSPPVTRQPDGSKKATLLTNPIVDIVIKELKPLPYSIQINTWAATSEKWLRICNADWVAPIIEKTKRPMPNEFEIGGWMSGWVATMLEYY